MFKVIQTDFQAAALCSIPPGNTAQPDKQKLTCDLSRLRREGDDTNELFMYTKTARTQNHTKQVHGGKRLLQIDMYFSPAVSKLNF